MSDRLSGEQAKFFWEEGYLHLGRVLDESQLGTLQQRIDAIMLGEADLDYDRIMMQLDPHAAGTDRLPPQTLGHKGSTLSYRKIEKLEYDPHFLAYLQRPLFAAICAEIYGVEVPVVCLRAMFMNKPAHLGSDLPWHQDRWNRFDRDPLVTVWTALDRCTVHNGCLQIVPRSHRSVINPGREGGFITPEQQEQVLATLKPVFLELEEGEAVLLHNYTLHTSATNRTDEPRRAFSVCYMDAATVASNGDTFPVIFGEGALDRNLLESASAGTLTTIPSTDSKLCAQSFEHPGDTAFA